MWSSLVRNRACKKLKNLNKLLLLPWCWRTYIIPCANQAHIQDILRTLAQEQDVRGQPARVPSPTPSTATEVCGHCSKKCEPGLLCDLLCDNQVCSEDCRSQCPWQPDLLPSLMPKCTIGPPEGFRLASDDRTITWEGQPVAVFFDEDDRWYTGVINFAPNDFGDVMVQYDDDHSFALKPIPGVLIAAGYVALYAEGGGMEEEEGAQGSRGDRKRRWGSGRRGGESRSKKQKGTPDARPGAIICPECTSGRSSGCTRKCHS